MTADQGDLKLSAILAADVVGQSRLMCTTEAALASLTGNRREHLAS